MSLWSRIVNTVRGDRHDAEIDEELQFHLAMLAGVDEDDPGRARLRLGNVTRIREETRAMGILGWIESALQDARYGLRQVRRTPALSLAVVLSLTIGLGANAAIFSLLDAAILKPVPVEDPDALVLVQWTNRGFPPGAQNHNGEYVPIADGRHQGSSMPARLYRQLAREQTAFAALMATGAYPDTVAIAAEAAPAEQGSIQYVSSNYFQGLGVRPFIGRPFRDAEDRVGEEPIVVVSHRFWVNRLGARSDVLDRIVRINNVPARIVGVAPAGFFGLRVGQWPDLYAPLAIKVAFQAAQRPDAPRAENDHNWWVRPVGRLRPGVSEASAKAQLAGLFRNLVVPEGDAQIPELVTLPGRQGFNALGSRDVSALWILLFLVGVLLLIVCANVANLLLSRSVGRQRESAVRLALGAGRTRLFRQHLIESAVLAVLGGAAGLALGYLLAHALHLLFQSGRDASYAFDLRVDLRALGYVGALSTLTALLFGLAPAFRAARADLGESIRSQTRTVTGGRLRLPRALVSVQIALCLSALVAAGLLGRSLSNLTALDVGFDRDQLAYASLNPAQAGYTNERIGPYVTRVREELARLPGVAAVSIVYHRALTGGGNNGRVHLPGQPWDDASRADMNSVGEGYFETMRIPILAGRALDRRDMHADATAVVVDEEFARRYFPDQNAVGRRFGRAPDDSSRYEIVGVAGNSRYNSLRGDLVPAIYEPWRAGLPLNVAIRSTLDAARLGESVRQAVASVDPAVPLTEFRTQSALIDRLLRTERLLGFVSAAFGVLALALAAIGLGGLLAYAVARRTSEIGVRMALGAAAGDVVRMVVRDSLGMAVAGILLGLPGAWVVGRLLKTALFGLEPMDAPTAALALLALLVVALLAAFIPARRAARIDPITALRE
jgi:predicted permease